MSQGGPNHVIKASEMEQEMLDLAIETARRAIDEKTTEKEIASYIKKEFESRYNPHWHCVIGRFFGAFVTFEAHHYVYFYIGQMGILLFKSP